MPEVEYQATPNAVITFSSVFFDGKGEGLFSQLKDYDMFMFKIKYSFSVVSTKKMKSQI